MKANIIFLSSAILFVQSSNIASPSFKLNAPNIQVAEAKNKPGSHFSFFRAHRQGKGITLTWGLNTSEEIAGFTVQRTYEDPNDPYAFWEDVSIIESNSSRSFKYTDTNALAGTTSYRVIAWTNGGDTIVSEVTAIRIMSRG